MQRAGFDLLSKLLQPKEMRLLIDGPGVKLMNSQTSFDILENHITVLKITKFLLKYRNNLEL